MRERERESSNRLIFQILFACLLFLPISAFATDVTEDELLRTFEILEELDLEVVPGPWPSCECQAGKKKTERNVDGKCHEYTCNAVRNCRNQEDQTGAWDAGTLVSCPGGD